MGAQVLRSRSLLALALTALLAHGVRAADPDDIARARDTSRIAECVRCDLSGADLSDGFFQFANLREVNLSNSRLDGANMAGVQLHGANLRNATLVYTNLSGAQLIGADVRGANFTKAWLNWAWFAGAKLDGANFAGAHLIGAQLQGADLSKVVGLTRNQLVLACGDALTKLPRGIEPPRCPY
jgi:uncharacterized protein YjbI with pentapeptide repeats